MSEKILKLKEKDEEIEVNEEELQEFEKLREDAEKEFDVFYKEFEQQINGLSRQPVRIRTFIENIARGCYVQGHINGIYTVKELIYIQNIMSYIVPKLEAADFDVEKVPEYETIKDLLKRSNVEFDESFIADLKNSSQKSNQK